jgi:hypothetical protein
MKQRGAHELLELFDSGLSETVERALELPAVHDSVFHAYDLVWFLARGHAAAHSPEGTFHAKQPSTLVILL